MIDDKWQRQRPHHFRQRHDIGRVDMQNNVPTAALDAIDNTVESGHVRCTAEMLDEVKTHAAYAAAIERIEILVGETVVYNGDAAKAFGVGCNAFQHCAIV